MATTKRDTQKVIALDYHRNGISGLGFHVGIVKDTEEGVKREMLVVRFHKEADKETGNIVCAAFDLALLDKRDIGFFHNSFRGDHFHEVMDWEISKRATKALTARHTNKTKGTKT